MRFSFREPAIAGFKPDVPGNCMLVDRAVARSLVHILHVEGAPNPDICDGEVMPVGH